MQQINFEVVLKEVFEKFKNVQQGETASYIPELAKVNPDHFALAVTTVDGKTYSVGDFEKKFTMQSTSKPLLYGLALKTHGADFVHSKVGVEPTGEAFNSIIELEEKTHLPFNPMINSGAIATTSLISGKNFSEKLKTVVQFFEDFVGHSVAIDEAVFDSEKKTAHRNRAISYLMKHFNVIDSEIEETLDLYFKQCSVAINCKDLAVIAATYANKGINPLTQKKILSATDVTKTLSLMFTCGLYDSAGEWAFSVGLPAKSGVSGAIFAVIPGRCGIAAYSPRIDEKGHSIRGSLSIQEIAKKLNAHIFN